MKILIISNLYPPYSIGGYEIGCKDVTEALVVRGHEVSILTSCYQCSTTDTSKKIARELLHTFPDSSRRSKSESYKKLMIPIRQFWNQFKFKQHVSSFRPDIIFFWNLSHIGTWLFDHAARQGIPSACYVSDQWLVTGYHDSSYPIKSTRTDCLRHRIYSTYLFLMSRTLRLQDKVSPPYFPRMFFTSRFTEQKVRAALTPGEGSEVIHWGIASNPTESRDSISTLNNELLSIVYSGQIIEYKGVKTAILAIAELVKRYPQKKIQFRLAGGGPSAFVAAMKSLTAKLGLDQIIIFEGNMERKILTNLLLKSDIYIFPSEWDEPFSISLLEGMASGCAVVSTTTGGSAEILIDGQNSLTYEAGNVLELTYCLERLLLDKSLCKKLSLNASILIHEEFRIGTMVDKIEKNLKNLININSN